MESFIFFIGIDISKATLDWAVIVSNKLLFHHQSTNDKAGIEGFIKQLKVYCPVSYTHLDVYKRQIPALSLVDW